MRKKILHQRFELFLRRYSKSAASKGTTDLYFEKYSPALNIQSCFGVLSHDKAAMILQNKRQKKLSSVVQWHENKKFPLSPATGDDGVFFPIRRLGSDWIDARGKSRVQISNTFHAGMTSIGALSLTIIPFAVCLIPACHHFR